MAAPSFWIPRAFATKTVPGLEPFDYSDVNLQSDLHEKQLRETQTVLMASRWLVWLAPILPWACLIFARQRGPSSCSRRSRAAPDAGRLPAKWCCRLTFPITMRFSMRRVMVGIPGKSFSVRELEAAGVRRISLATSLYRAAMTGFLDAVREIKDKGGFTFLERSVGTPELIKLMET